MKAKSRLNDSAFSGLGGLPPIYFPLGKRNPDQQAFGSAAIWRDPLYFLLGVGIGGDPITPLGTFLSY